MAELKKTLGFWMIVAISFLNLVNTGMFFGLQLGVEKAGVNVLLSLGILAILSIYIAMCFGELTSMFPSAGGVYEFAKQAYGRFISFLMGWTMWIAGNIALALFTVAAINAIPASLLPESGLMLNTALGSFFVSALIMKILLSVLLIVLLNYIAYRGIEASAKLMIFLSLFMMGIIVTIVVAGATHMEMSYLAGFTFQWSGIMLAIFFLSETFFGWESATYMSEETEDAERVIPRALTMTAIVVAVAVLAVAIVVIGVLGVDAVLNSPQEPIMAMLANIQAVPALIGLVSLGIVVALLGNASGNAVSLPRLLLAMSRDKLFIEQFSDVHPVRQTPHRAILFQTIISIIIILIALVMPSVKGVTMYEMLLSLLVPVSLLLYASVIVLVSYFRWTRPQHPRKFKVPGGSFLPVFVSLFFISLLVVWVIYSPNAISLLRMLFSFVFFSIPIYLILTYFYDPDSLIGTLGWFSRISLWFENSLVPKRIRREVIEFFTNGKDKHVLEFGSGVGTLTLHLAEHVGKEGKVYAVDFSESNINIIKKRMQKFGHLHVQVIHDPHMVNRVHPSVKYVDIIVSINNLSYVQDINKVLKEMNLILPPGGKICFVEYVDMFYFLPNPKWLSDPEMVKKRFADAGFSTTVRVRRGIFWKYMYIYGTKSNKNVPYI